MSEPKSVADIRLVHEKTFVPLRGKDPALTFNPLVDKLIIQAIADQNVELLKLDDFDQQMLDNDDASENLHIRNKVVMFKDIDLSDINDGTFDEQMSAESLIIKPQEPKAEQLQDVEEVLSENSSQTSDLDYEV